MKDAESRRMLRYRYPFPWFQVTLELPAESELWNLQTKADSSKRRRFIRYIRFKPERSRNNLRDNKGGTANKTFRPLIVAKGYFILKFQVWLK